MAVKFLISKQLLLQVIDSGGPLFLINEADGSLVQIGVFSGGTSGSGMGKYGSIEIWSSIRDSYNWLKTATPLREVSAKAGGGLWSDVALWNKREILNTVPVSWSPPSAGGYFNITLSQPGTVKLAMNPTIDSLLVTGLLSDLNIPSGKILYGAEYSIDQCSQLRFVHSVCPLSLE